MEAVLKEDYLCSAHPIELGLSQRRFILNRVSNTRKEKLLY